MATTLNADGAITENPTDTDIAYAFESLDKEKPGIFSGPGLSLIMLTRSEAGELTACGTYATGFTLSYQENPEWEYNTGMREPLPVDRVVRVFQACARGQDWGRSTLRWEPQQLQTKTGTAIWRLFIIVFFGYLAFVLIKKLFPE